MGTRSNKVYQNGQRIKGEGIKSILMQDPEALNLYNQGENLRIVSRVTLGVSLGLMAYSVYDTLDRASKYDAYRDGEFKPNWTFLIAGGLVGIPATIFEVVSRNKKEEAINIYNLNQGRKVSIHPLIGVNSAGLVIKF